LSFLLPACAADQGADRRDRPPDVVGDLRRRPALRSWRGQRHEADSAARASTWSNRSGQGRATPPVGEWVITPSKIGCGACSSCREGYFAQCDNANSAGKRAGTAFFGGPETAGGLRRAPGGEGARPL